jgi:hypothetical protein
MSLRKVEDTKVVIRNRKLKDRQYNDQKKKKKRTNNDLQNTIQKLKIESATRTPQHIGAVLTTLVSQELWHSNQNSLWYNVKREKNGANSRFHKLKPQ